MSDRRCQMINLTGDVANYVSQKDLVMNLPSFQNYLNQVGGSCVKTNDVPRRLPADQVGFDTDGVAIRGSDSDSESDSLVKTMMVIIAKNAGAKSLSQPKSKLNWYHIFVLIYVIALIVAIAWYMMKKNK